MRTIFILVVIVSLLSACRSSKVVGRAIGKKDSTAKAVVINDTPRRDSQQYVQNVLTAVQSRRIDYTTFIAKVDVDYKGNDGKEHNVNANVRMYRDSAIWLSVNATLLSIEGVRVLVTKDSVKVLNKVEKTYAARDISFLQETTSLPLDLYTLQDVIIGNPVYIDSANVRISRSGDALNLYALGNLFKNLSSFAAADTTIRYTKLTDVNPLRNRTADLTYGDYEAKTGVRFASRRQINVSEKGHLEIKLDFKNYSFNEKVSFPFPIPKNYPRL